MAEYVLFTDSSCDLPQELANELGLYVLPLTVKVDEKEYANYLDWRQISVSDFYNLLRTGHTAVTSAVNVWAYKEAMTPVLEDGKDILCMSFSSGLSNTYQAACIAAQELREAFPQRTILVVDTLAASLGQGMLIYYAAMEKQKGRSMEEVYQWVLENRLHLCHWFTVDDLYHLKRGGRVSAATAVLGSMLQIKPVLHVDDEGHLINMDKAKGRKASLRALVDRMEQTAIEPAQQTVFISHGDCEAEANYVADLVRQRMGVKKVIVGPVGPVIGAHSGCGTMALFFFGTKR